MDRDELVEEARERVAGNIRRFALKRGWTLVKVADFADVGRPHLSNVVNAKANLTLDWLVAVAAALGVDVADLLARPITPARDRGRPKRRPTKPRGT